MAGINKVIILGTLGKDPYLTYSAGGTAICKLSLATSRKNKAGEEKTSWHRCMAFGKTAEVIAQYVGKGMQLYVEGELSYGQYEKDGQTHYTTDIIVNEFAFVGGAKKEEQPQQEQPPVQRQQPQQRVQQFQVIQPQQQQQGQPYNQQYVSQSGDERIPF